MAYSRIRLTIFIPNPSSNGNCMNIGDTPKSLRPLVSQLEQLTGRASIEQVRSWLENTDATLRDLQTFVRYDENHYRRNLVCAGEWYEILVICWLSGQRSPIHDHAHSTCGIRVMCGTCTETVFGHAPCGQVVARFSKDIAAGSVTASQDSDTHQVSNLQEARDNLVTIHVYSPPLRAMKTFSIIGESDQESKPAVTHGF